LFFPLTYLKVNGALIVGTASEVDKARKEAEATLRSRLGQQDAALKQRFLRDKQQTVEAIEVQHSREMARITMTHEEQLTKAESAGGAGWSHVSS
jgi:hypothetical protein